MDAQRAGDERWSKVVPLGVAAIGAVGIIAAALVNALSGDDGASGGGTQTTHTSAPHIEVLSFGSQDVPPPPAVRYTFEGSAGGLLTDQQVFVLCECTYASGSGAGSASQTTPGYAVSPAATFTPSGGWRVDWLMERRPSTSAFVAVVTDTPVLAQPVPQAVEEVLERSGPSADVVLDVATVAASASTEPPGPETQTPSR